MKNYKVKINGKTYNVQLESVEEIEGNISKEEPVKQVETSLTKDDSVIEVLSPIQGNVINVLVKVGQIVKKGDALVIIEAMKLENEVNAPSDGEIVEVLVDKGQSVANNQLLIKMK